MPTELLLNQAHRMESELNNILVERAKEIHILNLAVCSGQHAFAIGTPGVAKSLVMMEMVKRITGARHQSLLLGADTTPDQAFGPYSIKDLKEGRYLRLIDGYLPTVHFAFYDEIWKTSDAMVNTLLTATNERLYDHGTERIAIPLSTLFCASNELPANETLAAIYDRILFRMEFSDIQEPANFQRMLLAPKPAEHPDPVMSWGDVEAIKAEVGTVRLTEAVADILTKIRKELHGINIFPSPRRFHQAVDALRAEAWMDGCDEILAEHVAILANVLWERPDQISQVEELVLQTANPVEKKGLALLADIDKIGDLVVKAKDAQDTDERQRLGVEAHKRVQSASKEYHDLFEQAGASRRQQGLLERCRSKLHTSAQTLIVDVFHLPPESNPAPPPPVATP